MKDWKGSLLINEPNPRQILGGKRKGNKGTCFASLVALMVKNLPANTGNTRDWGSIPGLGRPPGVGNSNLLQYSCLGNPVDRGAWWAIVHGVTKELGYDIARKPQADKKGHTHCGRGGRTSGLAGQEGYRMPRWQEARSRQVQGTGRQQ